MKVNLGIPSQNSQDWERIANKDFGQPPATADWEIVDNSFMLGDLAESLGFDGVWAPQHFGSPYGMTPNPLQMLACVAGRARKVNLGTMVIVAPWWHPVRLAHEIAYLDIISNGRLSTIGIGRGIAKNEFDALGIPREQARQRFNETLDILELAFSQELFSYEGEIFKIPEMSIRPAPKSRDLFSRIYSSSITRESLETLTRRGLVPLFVGNKPIEEAGTEVQFVNTIRQEIGLPPCQPKNVFFMYCTSSQQEVGKVEEYLAAHNRDTICHYGFDDPANYAGVKGYESYASRTVIPALRAADARAGAQGDKAKAYHSSNYLIGTPDQVTERIIAAQEACSFSEATIVPHFGNMPLDEAHRSVKLFAKEVLPAIHTLEARLHAAALPASGSSKR